MDAAILFAKGGQASGEEQLVVLAFIAVLVLVCLIYNLGATTDVVVRNGVPYCPNCNRQVRFRRGCCRSCGYQFRRFGGRSGRSWLSPSVLSQAAPSPPPIPTPLSYWEMLHLDPSDCGAKHMLLIAIEGNLRKGLLGPKSLGRDLLAESVVLRRTHLQYESRISIWIGTDRHGFEVTVPAHGLKLRISCPRVGSPNVVGAPWDDLLDNLCRLDRWVIKNRNSKSRPLTYNPSYGPHPGVQVEFLH